MWIQVSKLSKQEYRGMDIYVHVNSYLHTIIITVSLLLNGKSNQPSW